MSKDSLFIKLLKENTLIDEDFIDTFFKKFKIGGELDYDIKDSDCADYLGITITTLRKRLNNVLSKTKRFIENMDFIKIKTGIKSEVTYMLNYQCFERLAMSGDSVESETVRMYFVKLREFITNNQHLIYQAISNKKNLKIYNGMEMIYIVAIDERKKDLLKPGSTRKGIIERLRNYNVGRIKEVELKYLALVKHAFLIEKCLKTTLRSKQIYKGKELYKVEASELKKAIEECFCKHVKFEEAEQMYNELSNILGLYSYVKDKKNVKPYVIIGNDL
jgi:hypothetical protein